MNNIQTPIIIYDGYCNLCSSTVQFVIKEDKKKIFSYLSSDSVDAKLILNQHNLTEIKDKSIILHYNGKTYLGSTAILKVLSKFGGYYKFFAYLMLIIPKPLRDFVYYFISRNRYKWFGKRDSCFLVEEKD